MAVMDEEEDVGEGDGLGRWSFVLLLSGADE